MTRKTRTALVALGWMVGAATVGAFVAGEHGFVLGLIVSTGAFRCGVLHEHACEEEAREQAQRVRLRMQQTLDECLGSEPRKQALRRSAIAAVMQDVTAEPMPVDAPGFEPWAKRVLDEVAASTGLDEEELREPIPEWQVQRLPYLRELCASESLPVVVMEQGSAFGKSEELPIDEPRKER